MTGSWCLALVVGLAAAGSVLLAAATAGGLAVAPDSVDYVMAARELAAGHGLVVHAGVDGLRPLTHYPPLFPVVLGLGSLAGAGPLAVARWLHVALVAVNLVLVGLMLRKLDPAAFWAPVLGVALALVSPTLRGHSMVLSEPLFLALGFSGLLLLAGSIRSSSRSQLVAAGSCVGLAFLCRWAGVAFVAAGAAGLMLLSAAPRRQRALRTLVFTALAALPALLWMLRNRWVASSAAGRPLAWHPIGAVHLEQLTETLELWLVLPGGTGWIALVGLVLGIPALLVLARRRAGPEESGVLGRLLALFVLAYASMLVLAISFVDYYAPLNDRILAPVFVASLVLAVHGANRGVARAGRRAVSLAVGVAAALFLLAHAVEAGRWLSQSLDEGQPFFGRLGWEEAELIEKVRALPPEVHVYSNGADALYLLTERRASDLPRKANPASRRANPAYGPQMREVLRHMRSRQAVIVWLEPLDWRWYFPTKEELLLHHPVSPAVMARNGAIFVFRR